MNIASFPSDDFTYTGKQNRSVYIDKPPGQRFNSIGGLCDVILRPKSRDRHICGWQGQVLSHIDHNKKSRIKKTSHNHSKRKTEEDDYHRNLYKLKKEAEFLESDDEERVEVGKKKMRFPTESDITELISKETKYFPNKGSCENFKDQKQHITIKQRQLLMNSSMYLSQHTKRNYMRPSGIYLKSRNRPSTSNPSSLLQPQSNLLITAFKAAQASLAPSSIPDPTTTSTFQPIHTATKMRSRHRRKVRSVTDSFDLVCEQTAGLIGNAANLKPKINNFLGEPIHSGIIMFRKYNQIIKGKKLRTHRVSTVAM